VTSKPSVPANLFSSDPNTSSEILVDDSDRECDWDSDDDCYEAETGWDTTDDEAEEANACDNTTRMIEGDWN